MEVERGQSLLWLAVICAAASMSGRSGPDIRGTTDFELCRGDRISVWRLDLTTTVCYMEEEAIWSENP